MEHETDRLSEAVLQMWPDGHDVMVRSLWHLRDDLPSDKLPAFLHSRDEDTSGGSDSMGHLGLQALENFLESRRFLFPPEPSSNLPANLSARRIIRNLFITLAHLVSPTDGDRDPSVTVKVI